MFILKLNSCLSRPTYNLQVGHGYGTDFYGSQEISQIVCIFFFSYKRDPVFHHIYKTVFKNKKSRTTKLGDKKFMNRQVGPMLSTKRNSERCYEYFMSDSILYLTTFNLTYLNLNDSLEKILMLGKIEGGMTENVMAAWLH